MVMFTDGTSLPIQTIFKMKISMALIHPEPLQHEVIMVLVWPEWQGVTILAPEFKSWLPERFPDLAIPQVVSPKHLFTEPTMVL